MKKTRIIKILAVISVLILGLFAFYEFMTYDRNYTWSKEIENEIKTVAKVYGFSVIKTVKISVNSINLPTERAIKINIQKSLNKVNLMSYGEEYGESILLKSDSSQALLNCKIWCLSDHVIGLEIKYNHIEENNLTKLKQGFEKQFDNYKIIWTEITE